MRIGVIGGLDRNVASLQSLAETQGHEVGFHTGVMAGPASASALRSLVARSELVVIVTDINSHNAVRAARREARLRHRPLKIVRKAGSDPVRGVAARRARPAVDRARERRGGRRGLIVRQ